MDISLVHIRRCRLRASIWNVCKDKYTFYVITLFVMKLTVMTLIAKSSNIGPLNYNSSDLFSMTSAPDQRVSVGPSATNRTLPSSIWLIYNRIPRSGGLTMVFLLKELAKMNRFTHQRHSYRTPWQRLLIKEEQKNLVTWFEYQRLPKSYDRHFLHVNFSSFQRYAKHLRPTYINIIREPAELEYSAFRARRQDPLKVTAEIKRRDSIRPGSGLIWYSKSFSECVLSGDAECSINSTESAFSRSIPYFCGQDAGCLVAGSRSALQRAKFNVEYEYAVVGILSRMNETLDVLQHYVPRFFTGASQLYYKKGYGRRHENRDLTRKSSLSQQILEKLKIVLSHEYELYEFCNQRLYHQYQTTTKANGNSSKTK